MIWDVIHRVQNGTNTSCDIGIDTKMLTQTHIVRCFCRNINLSLSLTHLASQHAMMKIVITKIFSHFLYWFFIFQHHLHTKTISFYSKTLKPILWNWTILFFVLGERLIPGANQWNGNNRLYLCRKWKMYFQCSIILTSFVETNQAISVLEANCPLTRHLISLFVHRL